MENKYIFKKGDHYTVTDIGQTELARVFTNTTGQVYALTANISQTMGAACMTRLSRRDGDMRHCYLLEFAGIKEKNSEAFIDSVVTGYGDDSVQQLTGFQFVVENPSNLLTKKVERGRFGAHLEQSTRYIVFDKKDQSGRYKYYVPVLPDNMKAEYVRVMDQIFDRYSTIVHKLTEYLRNKHPEPFGKKERAAWINSTRATACDAARPVLPAATTSTVGSFMSAQAVESLVTRLLSEPLEEARHVGKLILEECRKVSPSFLKRADLLERGGATTAYRANMRASVANLAAQYLDPFPSSGREQEDVILLAHWPTSEMELVAGMLFEASTLPFGEISSQVSRGFTDEQRLEVFHAYMGQRLNRRHRPGRALEKAHFEWEIVSDYGIFRDLQRHRVVDDFEWQNLGVSYGFDVPALVTEAGLEETFRECFMLSEQLYAQLQPIGGGIDQYATLFGHKMRYRFITNLRECFHLLELRTGPAGHPGYRKICQEMYRLLGEVYPNSAKEMIFINEGESPELTRQAAEFATQYKLEQLSL